MLLAGVSAQLFGNFLEGIHRHRDDNDVRFGGVGYIGGVLDTQLIGYRLQLFLVAADDKHFPVLIAQETGEPAPHLARAADYSYIHSFILFRYGLF
jgi:hypothetical protein